VHKINVTKQIYILVATF